MSPAKKVLLLVAAAALVAAASAQLPGVDITALLNNPAVVTEIIQCLLASSDDGCSLHARLVKTVLPQLMQSNCAQCTEAQRQDVATVLTRVSSDRPDEWQQLLAKYDPDGSLRAQFGDEWRARGVNV